MTTALQYYSTTSMHGGYQFDLLSDIIDEMLAQAELNPDSYIKNKPRPLIVLAAKNGINELTFDMANDVLGLELEIGDDLQFIYPQDYVDWVRVCKVNSNGDLLVLCENRNNNIARTYLQAHNYSILFSNSGDPLEAEGNNAYNKPFTREIPPSNSKGGHFQKDTSKLSKHGEFIVDKQRGCFVFDSTLSGQSVVVQYISDGLQADEIKREEIQVHKYFRTPLMRYIEWELIQNDRNVPERQKFRAEKSFWGARQKAFSRFANIKLTELNKAFRSSQKWIKS